MRPNPGDCDNAVLGPSASPAPAATSPLTKVPRCMLAMLDAFKHCVGVWIETVSRQDVEIGSRDANNPCPFGLKRRVNDAAGIRTRLSFGERVPIDNGHFRMGV